MEWKERYTDKAVDAKTAVLAIRPGRRIFIGSGAAEPNHLVRALVNEGTHLEGNEIVHLLTLGPAPYVDPKLEGRFRHSAFFIGKNVREAVHEGRADFMPIFLSEIPKLIRSRRVPIDVALIQISPPDRYGFASLGVSVDIVRAAVDTAELVIAQVNGHQPRTLGDSFIHVDRIDYLIAHDEPLPALPHEPLDEVSLSIGRQIARLIPDGATLQMGIGRIPDAVLSQLDNHLDLGVHTEMFSDEAMRLAEAGVINGRAKTMLPGKMVTSFVIGTQELYEWLDDNPRVEFRPTEFTNDPFRIAQHDRMIAINSALAVDLTGQVAADTLMGRFFSGIGGQVDFVRGAARSQGGKPIIALPSTAKDGKLSRIQAVFEAGAGVVTSRGDVHYVVTEYGVADLWGKNIRQRAMALIEIAHPDFRGELLAAAKQRRYVFPDQIAPKAHYPWQETCHRTLPDGTPITIRPARLTDEEALLRILYSLTDRQNDYLVALGIDRASHEDIQQLVNLDYEQNMALVATVSDHDDVVGMAGYRLNPATRYAEVGLVVREDWQRRGVGVQLFERMVEVATARGLAGLTARISRTNRPMLGIVHDSGLETTARPIDEGATMIVSVDLPGSAQGPRKTEVPRPIDASRPPSAPDAER